MLGPARAQQQTMGLHLHFANFCMSYGKRSWACGSGMRVLYFTPKLFHCWLVQCFCAHISAALKMSKVAHSRSTLLHSSRIPFHRKLICNGADGHNNKASALQARSGVSHVWLYPCYVGSKVARLQLVHMYKSSWKLRRGDLLVLGPFFRMVNLRRLARQINQSWLPRVASGWLPARLV